MLLAILSDSHDHWQNLEKAVTLANAEHCDHLIFAGDLIAPPGLKLLETFSGPTTWVWGNNEGERHKLTQLSDASDKLTLAGDILETELGGLKLFMNHYPRITELAAKAAEFDLCIHGHTHIYREETIGQTLLLNPGEIQGYITGTPSFIIFDTTDRSIRKILLT